MSEQPFSTGVVENTTRWFCAPSKAVMAPPSPKSLLWIVRRIVSGSSWSGQPAMKYQRCSSNDQCSSFGVIVAWCTNSKWALSAEFSSTICGCTGSRSFLAVNIGNGG